MNCCPLCRSEFREGVVQCATCEAILVPSLELAEVRANPSRLLWMGRDSAAFELVARALREASIPAYAQERPTGIVVSLLKLQSLIHVLRADLDRALAVAAAALAGRRARRGTSSPCYQCGAPCPVELACCPQCKVVLLVEPLKEKAPGSPQPEEYLSGRKYCPLCDAEYGAAHDSCTLCGVELVPAELRGRPLHEKERHQRIDMVWKSGDPVAVSQAIAALREAGIPHHVKTTNDHFVFELGIPRPKYEIRVFRSDAEQARTLLEPIYQAPPFSMEEREEAGGAQEAEEVKEKRESERDWKAVLATAEIWSGEDAALAQILEDCLRENRIGVRRAGAEPGTLRLFVMPSDESAAREILREVREGTPPA